MKILCMAGGGAKGAYEVGVLKHLILEEKQEYLGIVGVSVGAINAAVLAQAGPGKLNAYFERLEQLWLTTNNDKVRKHWFPFRQLEALWKPSIYNSEPLHEWLKEEINLIDIQNSERKVAVGAVDLNTGKYDIGTGDSPNFLEWVIASSSFPVGLLPVEMDGHLWSDGGLRNQTPLATAIKMGATEIDVILTFDLNKVEKWDESSPNALDIASRSIEIMSHENAVMDLKVTGLKNDLAQIKPEYKDIKIRVFHPSSSLTDNSLEFNPKDIRMMMEQGYKDAVKKK